MREDILENALCSPIDNETSATPTHSQSISALTMGWCLLVSTGTIKLPFQEFKIYIFQPLYDLKICKMRYCQQNQILTYMAYINNPVEHP